MVKPALKYHCPNHPDRPPFCSVGDYTPCRECYFKLRGLKWIAAVSMLLLAACAAATPADSNDLLTFIGKWLKPQLTVETVLESNNVGGLVGSFDYNVPGSVQHINIQTADPNGLGLRVMIWNEHTRIVNLKDFVPISKSWAGIPKPLIIYYVAPRKYDDIYHSADCFARGKPLFGWAQEVYSIARHGIRRPCESCMHDLYLEWWMYEQLKKGGVDEINPTIE